jgi:glycosyltransferase involved in cell wall biosynthesis
MVPLAGVAARLLAAPCLLWIHGIEAWQPSSRRLANRMLSRMTAVVAVSEYTRQRFLSWSGRPPETVLLLPNAIHAARFGPGSKNAGLAKRYALEGRTVLLTLGRLAADEPGKGFDQVLELLPRLARRIPDVVYVIAGDGDDRARLERKAHRLGVDNRVVFTGAVPEQEKADLYRLADVYVMPSRGEGFGFVFLEAMACGVPVVASRVDGSREAVRGGELGLLVDPSSPAEIEAAVLQALQLPRQVPKGLEYFAFERFRERLGGILDCVPRADR